ncbi:MAG: AmmeMemoRadiSam system protein B, partial [Caldimicrobium sp.]
RDLQVEATKKFGSIVPLEEIIDLVKFLDEKGFLWSKNFEEIKERAYESWFQQKLRFMAHAGMSYPHEKEEAKNFLEDIFKLSSANFKEVPRILIVPHLDIRSGAKAYAEGYKRFQIPSGSRVVIFGVGHYLDYPYSVLTKDVATPFGILRNDRGGLLYLVNAKKIELFPDHIVHKLEHSVEFQTLFLSYLKGEEVVVLPFLIGSHRLLFENKALVEMLVSALIELIDERSYLVLGIDFCHLGLRYGDPYPINESLTQKALEVDKTLLELTFEGKVKDLEDFILETENMKICGASSLYLLAHLLKKGAFNGKGEIFYQEVAPFGEGSAVSIASAGYFF